MPNNYSTNIVYLSKAQYQELIANQTITVNGTTVTYNDNDIYVTPQEEPITDVKINGTSIGSNGVANVPLASSTNPGVVKVHSSYGHQLAAGILVHKPATDNSTKNGIEQNDPIVPSNQHRASFFGLAKAAGADMASLSSVTVGQYPDTQKAAIQNMLGITDLLSTEESSTATAAHTLNSTFMMDGKLHRATAAIAIGDAVEVGTNCEVVKADEVFVKKTDYPASGKPGVVLIDSNLGVGLNYGKTLSIHMATDALIKAGHDVFNPIVSNNQHKSIFYGLSKLAGVDLANEEVTLGTYPETSKTAIRSMIGAAATSDIPSVPVQDIQVNGTSVVSNGVANIPIGNANNLGVVKQAIGYGIRIGPDGVLSINYSNASDIKAGINAYCPIVPGTQHISTFYGLATAAGDTTQKTSSNAVGQYTDSAKASIKSMLGIQDGSTGTVDVSGTTPTITAVENTRYVCGEVATLDFTPPASGISIVRFTSGTTATVLTLPATVKFPEWFDSSALETDTIYEICITDGVYGAVMSWAL